MTLSKKIMIIYAAILFSKLNLTVKYKRSAGIKTLHFRLSSMFINIQFV